MNYLTNAFSLNMLNLDKNYSVYISPISVAEAKAILTGGYVPAVGHPDTAALIQTDLGLEQSPLNRVSLSIAAGDRLVVAQYVGPRLPEGTTQLPEGAKIQYASVTFE